jgi:hypothetical protein
MEPPHRISTKPSTRVSAPRYDHYSIPTHGCSVTRPVEIPICRNYTRPEESLVFGQLRKCRANEGTSLVNLFPEVLTTASRPIGTVKTNSKFGSLLPKFPAWPRSPPRKIGLTQGNCLQCTPMSHHRILMGEL